MPTFSARRILPAVREDGTLTTYLLESAARRQALDQVADYLRDYLPAGPQVCRYQARTYPSSAGPVYEAAISCEPMGELSDA